MINWTIPSERQGSSSSPLLPSATSVAPPLSSLGLMKSSLLSSPSCWMVLSGDGLTSSPGFGLLVCGEGVFSAAKYKFYQQQKLEPVKYLYCTLLHYFRMCNSYKLARKIFIIWNVCAKQIPRNIILADENLSRNDLLCYTVHYGH